MVRPSSLQRYLDLSRAALEVFRRKGLHRAQMSDIAREAGVSAGTLYNYFESKDALFAHLVERALMPPPDQVPSGLPLPERSRPELLARVADQLDRHHALTTLRAALEDRAEGTDPAAEVGAIVDELYALTERTAAWVDVLERSAMDAPDLAQLFVVRVRRPLFADLTAWVASRQARGVFRANLDPAVAARAVVEQVTMFARHRHRDPDPQALDESAVQDTVRAMLVAGLVDGG